jgi:hypothetical protein
MVMDGTSHLISDLAGIGQGFRDSNTWLAALTQNTYPAIFYAGDAWGSFNSLMRLLTGILFGLGIIWFGFHYLNEAFSQVERSLEARINPIKQMSPQDINRENFQ